MMRLLRLVFARARDVECDSGRYVYWGEQEYRTEGVSSFQAIVNNEVAASEGEFHLLDIGAGGGEFVDFAAGRCPGLIGHALNASDLRAGPLASADYTQGNADRLLDYYVSGSMDMIVSRYTMQHLPDNLRTLGQMYVLLKPGGLIALDEVWPSVIDWLPHRSRNDPPQLVAHLKASGFDVQGGGRSPRVRGFMLRKHEGDGPFTLPVEYSPRAEVPGLARQILYRAV